jgi:hypothetical protein
MNACFLSLTDKLVISGWLEQDTQTTKAVQKTIESFITLVRASNVSQDDEQDTSDYHSPGVATPRSVVSDISFHPIMSDPEEMAVASALDARLWDANQVSDSESFAYDGVSSRINTISELRLPRSIDPPTPSFAQRLHVQAIQAGLRLVCTAEDHSMVFYRVFNRVLDLNTREGLKTFLHKVLDSNYNQLLQPPVETDLDMSWSEEVSEAWLSASDVARYFRTIGMDLEGPQGIVTVEVPLTSLLTKPANTQGLVVTDRILLHGDNLEKSSRQQPPNDQVYLSNGASNYVAASPEETSNFGVLANSFSYTARSGNTSNISIDVSRLIHGEYLSFNAQEQLLIPI